LNIKAVGFVKNLSYTIYSNLIALIASTLIVLLVAKLIGVEDYGYWQLFLFYSTYVGLLHFGWNDGIYLRYGGEAYSALDKKLFYSQFVQLLVFEFIVGIVIGAFGLLFIQEAERVFILKAVIACMFILNSRYMLLFVLQATNRIKEYARATMLDRIVYIALVILFLGLGVRDYKAVIIADLIGKLFGLFCSMLYCKDIVFRKVSDFKLSIEETIMNLKVGVKLMFATIASMLIIGIVRFGIERTWDVATFGKISLTLSVSNMMMLFINAVGIIMFPILRRTGREKLASIYETMRDFLMVLLLGFLIAYYPLKTVISAWLPQYAESLSYMALVFPMFIYEGKMALLISTYLKTMRREKAMMKINLFSMLLSLVLTILATLVLRNLDIAITNIVLVLALRSALSEFYLAKELKIRVHKDIFLETGLTIIFMLSGWFMNSWATTLVYGCSYVIYLMIKRKEINTTFASLKTLVKT
jgi:O-antigen/teichoic acid export membrane protein